MSNTQLLIRPMLTSAPLQQAMLQHLVCCLQAHRVPKTMENTMAVKGLCWGLITSVLTLMPNMPLMTLEGDHQYKHFVLPVSIVSYQDNVNQVCAISCRCDTQLQGASTSNCWLCPINHS